MLKLIHLSTIKNYSGLLEISVKINGKEYIYLMKSEYDIGQFYKLLRFRPGQALNYLKKYCIK